MDIWDWVFDQQEVLDEQGEEELLDIMEDVSSDTVDGRHQRLDQYIDTGIQRARELGLGWVEVFLRHWRLQSHVLVRNKPKDMIKEAISLLEFAHRPENKNCPQSICAVQDLANCYAIFDGPGFFQERLQVAKENLDKINANWSCYICISAEYATALIDAGRYQECIDFLDNCDKELVKFGEGKDRTELLLIRVRVLVLMGEYSKARNHIKRARLAGGGSNFTTRKSVLKALIAVYDGCYDEAQQCLPELKAIEVVSSQMAKWAEIKFMIASKSDNRVSKTLINQFKKIVIDMEDRGVYRDTFNTLGLLAELYDKINDKEGLEQTIESMVRVKSFLNKDAGAENRILELTQ